MSLIYAGSLGQFNGTALAPNSSYQILIEVRQVQPTKPKPDLASAPVGFKLNK